MNSSQKKYKWLKIHEEMFNTLRHYGNRNQNDTEERVVLVSCDCPELVSGP
jgi:hypothetical protein